MKKILVIAVSMVVLTVAMAVPACAVTPALKIPDMPEISNIKIDINVGSDKEDDVVGTKSFWDRWFAEHPIVIQNNVIKSRYGHKEVQL